MITEAIICDNQGIPWTAERFCHEPEAAQDFLQQLTENSYGYPEWQHLLQDQIIHEASYRLHLLQQDLVAAELLKAQGKLT